MDITEAIRILLVDDSRTARDYYANLFKKNGYQVRVACGVDDALQMLHEAHFDIAIVDYFMPGANGDVLCRAIRADAQNNHMPTAILSASSSDEVIRISLGAGATDCLFKDEPVELLLARLAAMVHSVKVRKTVDRERRCLAGILSTLSEGVYGVDVDSRITFMNPAGLSILRYHSEVELIGLNPHTAFHYAHAEGRPNPAETCYLHQAYELGDALPNWESIFWTRTGKQIWVECSVAPVFEGQERQGSVVAFRDITMLREHLENLHWQAYHDSLTRLPNRRHFMDALVREFYRLKRSDEVTGVMYIDLDKFKKVNDVAGHAAGDRLLMDVSELLVQRLRGADVLARLGGDEFGLMLQNVSKQNVVSLAEQFRSKIAGYTFVYAGQRFDINASVGVALMDSHSSSPDEVLSQADTASYTAKRQGGTAVSLYVCTSDPLPDSLDISDADVA
jgi:diguanylate cyclase (GGDEF)-like protein/PAS domain S-box-containing protein